MVLPFLGPDILVRNLLNRLIAEYVVLVCIAASLHEGIFK